MLVGERPASLQNGSRAMRVPSAAAVVVLLCGCLPARHRHGERQRDPALDSKVVVAKEEPISLIAGDGSRCLLADAKKYARTALGDHVWCMWSAVNGEKTAYSWDGRAEPPGKRREPGSGGSRSFGRP